MIKKKNGFTVIELLAVLVLLGIIMGIVLVTVNGGFGNAKNKTEDIFIKTIEDALNIYIDSDAKGLTFDTEPAYCVDKTHKNGVKIYKSESIITFNDVINSDYKPLTKSDFVNPANKDTECNTNASIEIYRDEDYVYYYRVEKSALNCLTGSGYIDNLPDMVNCN